MLSMNPVYSKIDAKGFACVILPELDYDAQLIAIRHLLIIHKKIAQDLDREIDEFGKSSEKNEGRVGEYLMDLRDEKLQFSVYQGAAHSMSAVGMLAPLMESIFYQAFHGIRKNIFVGKQTPSNHSRWTHSEIEKWDCHFAWGKKGIRGEDLVRGIIQLSEATGLKPFLPHDLEIVLKVLFSYRNKMFHCGFEWPVEERTRFWSRIQKDNWPTNWLDKATINGVPWVIYLTDEFIWHCVETIELLVDSFGKFVVHKSGIGQKNLHDSKLKR